MVCTVCGVFSVWSGRCGGGGVCVVGSVWGVEWVGVGVGGGGGGGGLWLLGAFVWAGVCWCRCVMLSTVVREE